MGDYHPDPDLLDALATVWFNKADEVDKLRRIGPDHIGDANWTGSAQDAAVRLLDKVSSQLSNTSELARRWARNLNKMAKKVRDELAEEAKNAIIMILASIFGLFAGLFVGWALGPVIAAIAAALAAAIAGASEIFATILTLVFEFTLGALAFGSMQFAMDMAIEGIASAITSTPFELNSSEWVNVLVASLTGGLFSLGGAAMADLKSLPFRGDGKVGEPPITTPVDTHPEATGFGGEGLGGFDGPGGSHGVEFTSGDNLPVGSDLTTDLGKTDAITFSPATADLGNGEANLGTKPRVPPDVQISESSFTRDGTPGGGSVGGRNLVNETVHPNPGNGKGVVAPRVPPPSGSRPVTPKSVTNSKNPPVDLDHQTTPQTVEHGGGPTGGSPVRLKPPTLKPPTTKPPADTVPRDEIGGTDGRTPDLKPHNQAPPESVKSPTVKSTTMSKIPDGTPEVSPPAGVHSEPPPTPNPASGHPSARFTTKHLENLTQPPAGNAGNAPHPNTSQPATPKLRAPEIRESTEGIPHNEPAPGRHGPTPSATPRNQPSAQPATPRNQVPDPKSQHLGDANPNVRPPTVKTGGVDAQKPKFENTDATGKPPTVRGAGADPVRKPPATTTPEGGGGLRKPPTIEGSEASGLDDHQPVQHEHPPETSVSSPKPRAEGGSTGHVSTRAGTHVTPHESVPRTAVPRSPERAGTQAPLPDRGTPGSRGPHAEHEIDAAATRLRERFVGQHRDPVTGEPHPQVTRAVDAWVADAKGLVKRAVKAGRWDRLDGDLKTLEGRFDGYLAAQRGADAAADRAVARFDKILSDRGTPVRADPDRVSAQRAELGDAARNAYLARWGSKSILHRGKPGVEKLDERAARWLLKRDQLIHVRLNYLERTQPALDKAEADIRSTGPHTDPNQMAENDAMMRQAEGVIDSRSGNYAAQIHPRPAVIANAYLRQFVRSVPARTGLGNRAGHLFETAQASIKSEASAGEAEAFGRGLNHVGSADRAIASAQERLRGVFTRELDRLEEEGFKPSEIERSMNILRTRVNRITGGVRRAVIDDASTRSAEADRILATEAAPRSEPRPDPHGDAASVSDVTSVRGRDSVSDLTSISSSNDFHVFHVEVDAPRFNPDQLLRGGKGGNLFGAGPHLGELPPAKGDVVRPANEIRISVKSDLDGLGDVGRPPATGDEGAVRPPAGTGEPPTYRDMLRGDELPDYETARLDPPPGLSREDIARYLAENLVERRLIVPKPLDTPMDGVGREMDAIRQERRDAVAQQVEDLGRVGQPEPKGSGGDRFDDPVADPTAKADPYGSLRERAWNAMAKQEADLRATVGDGVRPGQEGGGFANGRPIPPRSGRQVAEDVTRFARGPKDGPPPDAAAVKQHVEKIGNEELDRANSWLRNNPESPIRDQIHDEWKARVDRGDLTPGIGTVGAHEAVRRLDQVGTTESVDLNALRADYAAKARTAGDLQAVLDRLTAQRNAVREAIRRQYLGGERRHYAAQPFESIPARATALQRLGVDITPERLVADPHVAKADGELTTIATERVTIGNLKMDLTKAIDAAERRSMALFPQREASSTDAARYAEAHNELTLLRTFRDKGLVGLELWVDPRQAKAIDAAERRAMELFAQPKPGGTDAALDPETGNEPTLLRTLRDKRLAGLAPRVDPRQAALFQRYQEQGLVEPPRVADVDPERIGAQTLNLIDELRTAIARLDGLPVPRPDDPEWVAAHPGTRADEAVAEWLDAYNAVHGRWDRLPAWQRQGLDARDRTLRHFQQTALYQREEALLNASEPAVRGASARASAVALRAWTDLTRALQAEERNAAEAGKPSVAPVRPARRPPLRRPSPPPPRPRRPRPVEPRATEPATETAPETPDTEPKTTSPTTLDVSSEAVPPTTGDATPVTRPDTETPPPSSIAAADISELEARFAALRNPTSAPRAETPVEPVGAARPVDPDELVARFKALRNSPPTPRDEASAEPVASTTPVAPNNLVERFNALRSTYGMPPVESGTPPRTAPRPTVDEEPSPVTTPPSVTTPPPVTTLPSSAVPPDPDLMRFSDPERQRDWQRAEQNMIDDLMTRLGNAAPVNRIVPDLEADFVRTWHATPGGSGLREAQLVEQFERFGAAAARTFDETLSAAFAEVRPPTAAEREAWQQRYGDLVRDLGDDLREQIGRNEIDAAANRAFDRWRANDPDLASAYNEALRHWTEDTGAILRSVRAGRNWDHAEGSLARQVEHLDVYLGMHLGAQRAALRVGDLFDELVAARPATFADPDRVRQARAEAVAAGYARYLRWWRPSRIYEAVGDLGGMVARADSRFREFPDAIRTRLSYLDETQEILDWMARITRPENMPRRMPRPLDTEQLEAAARMAQREAESFIDSSATPFVEEPPEVTESMLKVIRRAVYDLREQIPARAAFAARAAELTRAALDKINSGAAEGAAEAVRHGLDPAAALSRVPSEARTAVFDLVRDIRERFADQRYAESELAGKLAALERGIGDVVGRVRANTVRDALLRRGDTEAVATLNQHAAGPGSMLRAPVQQRIYGDFEREYVRQYHVLLGDGADVDIAAWLSRTPPEEPVRPAIDDGPEVKLLTWPESSAIEHQFAELPSLKDSSTPAERRALRIERLPEAERAEWQQKFDGAADDADRSRLDRALAVRFFAVVTTPLANDIALAELVRDAGEAWARAGAGRVTSAAFGALIRRFKDTASELNPHAEEPVAPPEFPSVDLPDPVPTPKPLTGSELMEQLSKLPPPAITREVGDLEARLSRMLEGWFQDSAKPLPYKIREKFWAEWLTFRNDPDKSAAIRQRMVDAAMAERVKPSIAQRFPDLTANRADEFARRIDGAATFDEIAAIEREAAEAARIAAARPRPAVQEPQPAAPQPAGQLDAFDEKYEIVPKPERDRFRRDIAQAAAPEKLEEAYAVLDARRDELMAAAAPVTPKSFEEQLTILKRFVPRHGYRVIRDDVPVITAEQAAAYDRELDAVGSLDEQDAFERRLSEAGYQKVPVESANPADARLAALPAVPMGDDDLVGMVRAWADDEAHGSGLGKAALEKAVGVMADALAARDGSAFAEAIDGFKDSMLEAGFARLERADAPSGKPVTPPAAKPTEIPKAPTETPSTPTESAETAGEPGDDAALAVLQNRFAALKDEDAEVDALRADPALRVPDTDPRNPVAPRSLEALRREMPDIPETAPHEGWTGDGPPAPNPDGFDEETFRMAQAEGRIRRRGNSDPTAELMRRLRRLNESPEEPPPAGEVAKPPAPKPADGEEAQGFAEVEVFESDGTVVTRRVPKVAEPATSGQAGMRQQLAERDEIDATEAAYNSYLDLERDLRADREDLASRFAAKLDEWRAEHPELAATLDGARIARLQEGIARLAAKHFLTVRETLPSPADQRTMIAGFLAEKVDALGPELTEAVRPKPADTAPVTIEAPPGPRVDELSNERFDGVVSDFRRGDLFGGRYLRDEDYARLRDSFTEQGRAAAGTAGLNDGWTPTAEWASTMDTAAARLGDQLFVRSAGGRWFGRMLDAVAYDRGDQRGDVPEPPQSGWYREQFQQRLQADYAKVFANVPPGSFRSEVAYLEVVADPIADATRKREPTPWPEALKASLDWVRDQLSFAYDLRRVLESAAGDLRRITLNAGADAATSAALADLFRLDKAYQYLTGRGLAPETYDAWLDREKADTDVFGARLATLSIEQERQPAEFSAKAAQATDALITEYKPRVATAGEVATRRPDFAGQFADAVTRAAEQTQEIRDRVGDDNLDRLRTLDALGPGELLGWRNRVVGELTELYHRVWYYAVQVGAAVDSEHWNAAAQRWDELSRQYWDGLRTTVMRQNQIARLNAAIGKLRTDAEAAGLATADAEAAVALFTRNATAKIDRLLHTRPFDLGRLDRWAELESELADSLPAHLKLAQTRAEAATRAATAYQERAREAGRSESERKAGAAEASASVAEAFDRAYRQSAWADEDQRLAQADYLAARQQGDVVAELINRKTAEEPESVAPEQASAPERANPIEALAEGARRRLATRRAGADKADQAALHRVGAEIESIISSGLRDYVDATDVPALGQRAVDKARSRIEGLLRDLSQRLADERRLAEALAAATGKFDALPGADRLGVGDPLRQRFLREVAGKTSVGIAHLTSSVLAAAVAAEARQSGPKASGSARTELTKAGHAPGGRLIPTADGVYLAAGTDLGPPARPTATEGDFWVVAGPGSLELLMAYLQSAAGATSLAGVTVDLGLLTDDADTLRAVAAGLPLLFGVQVDGVETDVAPASETAPNADSTATTGTTTSDAIGHLPTTLPPVELTPLATRPPAEAPSGLELDTGSIEVDPEDLFRADLYDRLGSVPAPAPVEDFPDSLDGERAAVHWSLQSLAHHGEEWLDRGVAFLDTVEASDRERLLVDAVREAPTGTLLAFSRLIRGVSAHPERDYPVSVAVGAVHLALTGNVAEAVEKIHATWKNEMPAREPLIDALVRRSVTGTERAALSEIGVALVTC
ncbi:hypothetical protein GCM10023322_08350 [Rugosimonospora acidiphila]|uniref:Uncharacterized protein n=1 Tax=Rugosimonospora acidiphila TaxID=556531 RepID=A0ABP9RKZ7_9ACTN